MNYIKLLNAAFEKFYYDDRLNPSHISLYIALFQDWNRSRFADEMFVSRQHLMRISKIGSNSTYHRCIVDLNNWQYLTYFPSRNPFKGSKIKMAIIRSNDEAENGYYNPKLEQLAEQYYPRGVPVEEHHHPNGVNAMNQYRPNSVQAVNQHRPKAVQALVSNINNNKQENFIKQPKGRQAVILFFEEKSFDADEGKKFFEHYEDRGWKTSDGKPIRDWRSLATNWMDRTEFYSKEYKYKKNKPGQKLNNLSTTKNKDYGQPL